MNERNILIAFDGSENSLKAVDYAGSLFSGLKDIRIALLYVVPSIPPQFWDDGHILSAAEKEERQAVIDRWLSNQKSVLEPLFEKARRILTDRGFSLEQIETRMAGDTMSVADAIIEEAKEGGYRTVILGRQRAVPMLAGSLATTILHKGTGLAICIVE